jgi:hypothetical protein
VSAFEADNSRIRVTEKVSGVDETVFDTDDDMPHIVGTAQVNNQTVDFAQMSQTEHYYDQISWSEQQCEQVYVTTNEWVTTCGWQTTCAHEYVCGGFPYSCGMEYVCSNNYVCENELVTTSEWVNQCSWVQVFADRYRWAIDADENSSTINIANIPTDETGSTVDVDFIVVQATGARTRHGKDPRFNQVLPTSVPTKTFSFQGSVLLESSGRANGDSWMRRIVSVYRSGSKVKMRVQESIAQLNRDAFDASFPHAADTRSTYNFNFKVFFGKFRQ